MYAPLAYNNNAIVRIAQEDLNAYVCNTYIHIHTYASHSSSIITAVGGP